MLFEDLLLVSGLVGVPVVGFSLRAKLRRAKLMRLEEKYGSHEIAVRILAGQVWQGMTAEMLRDSRGKPDDLDRSVYKKKVKETWKYTQVGKNRYKERILIEDDEVVGWR